ncbi:T9SS type A sorting domain-containing protein [Flammeovirga yaeyamensis]|uniref:T9SS type A sorting domain-containing protein n=1 Tax=Flammeovirga yaeyamensis TaxID=367791 RepID=A0AAX1NBR0_9BACT|nr:T9SS type A sorting domain-containing protein [Flammeovirga yaeyamensis]MBB3697134.1 Leucine-rich repeat (LRR) protein [Flammeovirga yaeyamensis]NMF33797.1 T9SS type A sorting domain-containing protein [Flammeovirga yaeyamensis]QWG04939.1 T9SS type A sorting domain-containing protein [Flammeovirga yaeyamensis]
MKRFSYHFDNGLLSVVLSFIILFLTAFNAFSQSISSFTHNESTHTNSSNLVWDLTGESIFPVAANFTVLVNDMPISTVLINVVSNTDGSDYDIMTNISYSFADGDNINLQFNQDELNYYSSRQYIFDSYSPNFNVVQINTDNPADNTLIDNGNTVYLKVIMSEPIETISAQLEGEDLELSDQTPTNFTFIKTFDVLPTETHSNPLAFSITALDSAGNSALKSTTTDASNVYFSVSTTPQLENYINTPSTEVFCNHDINLTLTGNVVDTASITRDGETAVIHWEQRENEGEWTILPNSNSMNFTVASVPVDGNYAYKRVISNGTDTFYSNEIDIDVTDVDAIAVTTFPNTKRFNVNSNTAITMSTNIDNDGVILTCSGAGVMNNSFTPNSAGVGSHQITYSLSDGNCTKTVQTVFHVFDPTTLLNLPSVICSNTPNQNITMNTSTNGFNDLTLVKVVGDGITVADPLLLQPNLLFDETIPPGGMRNIVWEAFFVGNDGILEDSVEIPVSVYKKSELQITVNGNAFTDDSLFIYNDDPNITLGGNVNGESFSLVSFSVNNETPQMGNSLFSPQDRGAGVYWVFASTYDLNACSANDTLIIKVKERQTQEEETNEQPISSTDSLILKSIFDELQISYNSSDPISDWPRYLSNTSGKITQLDLSNTPSLTHLPEKVRDLKKLQILKVANCNLQSVSDSIWRLKELWLLDLSYNQLEDDDVASLAALRSLRTLYIHHNSLNRLPQLSGLDDLRHVLASHNNIHTVDRNLQGSNQLRILDLSYNNLDTLGDIFENKSFMSEVYVDHNVLKKWSYSLPTTVIKLDISNNKINNVTVAPPSETQVNVSFNQLDFSGLSNLNPSNTEAIPQFNVLKREYISKQLGDNYSHNYAVVDGEVLEWFKDTTSIGVELNLSNISMSDKGMYSCYSTHSNWTGLRLKLFEAHVGVDCAQQDSIQILSERHTWFCSNENINIQLYANPIDTNLAYQWYVNDTIISDATNPTFTTFKEGVYTVRAVTSGGCLAYSNSLTVNQKAAFTTPDILYQNQTLRVGNADSTKVYSWYFGDEFIADQTLFIHPSRVGKYVVKATDSLGCSVVSDTMNIQDEEWVTSLSDQLDNLIKVYPNPSFEGKVNIEAGFMISTIKLYDLSGKLIILDNRVQSNDYYLNSLKSGIYFVKLFGTNKEIVHQKIIVGDYKR